MRWIRDLALLLVLAAFIGSVILHQRREQAQEQIVQHVGAEVRRLETEIKYRAATANANTTVNARGWPVTVDPKWFEISSPPMNTLVSPNRPWIEVASASEAGLLHPPMRVVLDDSVAAFWYNPYQGVVRARVPSMLSDEQSLELYNRINTASIPSLFWLETPMPMPDMAAARSAGSSDQQADSAQNESAKDASQMDADAPIPGFEDDHAAAPDGGSSNLPTPR